MNVARKAPAIPSTVVRMKPVGLLGPGESIRATIPTKIIQMMPDILFAPQAPTASVTHFFVKLVFAAPASFLSFACPSHDFCASDWHFFMKLLSAAPASFLSSACPLHVGLCA